MQSHGLNLRFILFDLAKNRKKNLRHQVTTLVYLKKLGQVVHLQWDGIPNKLFPSCEIIVAKILGLET